MKSKALISLAVASTFGWSAAAFAGTGHEVVTPFSPNESGENIFVHQQGFGSTQLSSIGSTSSGAEDSVAFSDEGMNDSLALADDGVYSDYYLVSWTPMTSDGWDYYLIDTGSDELASADEVYILTPVYDVVVLEDMSSDFSSDLGE